MVVTGLYYALSLALIGTLVGYFTRSWAGVWGVLPFFVLAIFCLWFFRDPDRKIPSGRVAVSPADGKIVLIKARPEGTSVSVFLNIFDVHVNRSPIAGKVIDVQYRPGKFLVASHDAASLENEMNTITVEGENTRITFSQIAGLIARRIVCYKKPGDFVTAGERVGLIKFGSRVDIHFGPEWVVEVAVGQRVSAGSSILARRKG